MGNRTRYPENRGAHPMCASPQVLACETWPRRGLQGAVAGIPWSPLSAQEQPQHAPGRSPHQQRGRHQGDRADQDFRHYFASEGGSPQATRGGVSSIICGAAASGRAGAAGGAP